MTLAKLFGDGEVTTVTLGGSTSAAPQQLTRLGKLPGAHALHVSLFAKSEYQPAGQLSHSCILVALPLLDMRCPG